MDFHGRRKIHRDFCRTVQEDENCPLTISSESLQKVNSESARPSGTPPRERATPNLALSPWRGARKAAKSCETHLWRSARKALATLLTLTFPRCYFSSII